jgi:hypothetical protein
MPLLDPRALARLAMTLRTRRFLRRVGAVGGYSDHAQVVRHLRFARTRRLMARPAPAKVKTS